MSRRNGVSLAARSRTWRGTIGITERDQQVAAQALHLQRCLSLVACVPLRQRARQTRLQRHTRLMHEPRRSHRHQTATAMCQVPRLFMTAMDTPQVKAPCSAFTRLRCRLRQLHLAQALMGPQSRTTTSTPAPHELVPRRQRTRSPRSRARGRLRRARAAVARRRRHHLAARDLSCRHTEYSAANLC